VDRGRDQQTDRHYTDTPRYSQGRRSVGSTPLDIPSVPTDHIITLSIRCGLNRGIRCDSPMNNPSRTLVQTKADLGGIYAVRAIYWFLVLINLSYTTHTNFTAGLQRRVGRHWSIIWLSHWISYDRAIRQTRMRTGNYSTCTSSPPSTQIWRQLRLRDFFLYTAPHGYSSRPSMWTKELYHTRCDSNSARYRPTCFICLLETNKKSFTNQWKALIAAATYRTMLGISTQCRIVSLSKS